MVISYNSGVTADGGYKVDGFETVSAYIATLTVDTQFVASYEPIKLEITFIVGEMTTTQPAYYGKPMSAPGLPAGYEAWCVKDVEGNLIEFDFSLPLESNMTFYAKESQVVEVYSVIFISEGEQVAYFADNTKRITVPDIVAPAGKKFIGWFVGDDQIQDPVAYVQNKAENTVFVAKFTEADAPAGPGFFETNEGKCVAVILGVVILAFVYAVYTNMFGMKDFLTSFKIQRVKKE